MSVGTQALLLVLKYVGQAVLCSMRLTKRGGEPVLRFEFNFVDSGNSLVVHDVPVEILRSELAWAEPLLPDADTKLVLSFPVRKLTSHVERLKHMGINEVGITVLNHVVFSDIKIVGMCDSVKTELVIQKQQVYPSVQNGNLPMSNLDEPDSLTEINVTAKGLAFILGRIASLSDSSKCVIMASETKYLSAWVQLPNQYGNIAAVTPAILID